MRFLQERDRDMKRYGVFVKEIWARGHNAIFVHGPVTATQIDHSSLHFEIMGLCICTCAIGVRKD